VPLARLARDNKGVSLLQLALACVTSQPLEIYALVGCNSGAEFETNLGALGLELSNDKRVWLESGGKG